MSGFFSAQVEPPLESSPLKLLPPSTQTVFGRLRLRHLQCVLAVARLGNLRRAAQAMSVSQPAVTKTLREVEEILGVTLFNRSARGVVATPEAEVFIRHAREALAALGRAVEAVRPDAVLPPLRIGVLPTVSPFLAPVVEQWLAQSPRRHLQVGAGSNAQLLDALRQRQLDAVIGRLADISQLPGLQFEHLYTEPMVVVARPGHPALQAQSPLEQGHPLILPLAGTLIRQIADAFLQRLPSQAPPACLETLDVALSRALVRKGDYLWFIPKDAVHADLADGVLSELPLRIDPDEAVGLYASVDNQDPELQQLLVLIREVAARRRG